MKDYLLCWLVFQPPGWSKSIRNEQVGLVESTKTQRVNTVSKREEKKEGEGGP